MDRLERLKTPARALRIAATIAQPGFLVLRLRSYPAWVVKVNGRAVSSLLNVLIVKTG